MDGIYALGGMTRLVARKSTSPSSSQAGSVSPISQPASPHYTIRDLSTFQSNMTQQHTHLTVQSTWSTFNRTTVPDINVFQSSQYLATSPAQQDAHYSYDTMYQDIPPSTPFEAIPGFYGYPSSGGAFSASIQMTPVDNGMPAAPDVTASWHNLIAQYK